MNIHLSPDFNKLKFYFRDKTDAEVADATKNGVTIGFEYLDENEYERISQGLRRIFNEYGLSEHYNELLYFILRANESSNVQYNQLVDIYNENLKAREVAQFLLAIHQLKANEKVQLVVKPTTTPSVAIKDVSIATWMAELIYTNIEQKNFPLDLFGTTLSGQLFNERYFDEDSPLDLAKLEALANSRPKNPKPRLKKLNYQLCIFLQPFLEEHTHMTLPDNVKLTDAQANFFFDVLELIGYFDRESIDSEPKDYMHALFANNSK